MTDVKTDKNNLKLINATKKLGLRFPVADISKKVGYNKGDVSSFLNSKKPVSDEFLEKFAKAYDINFDEIETEVLSPITASITKAPPGKFDKKKNLDLLVPFYDIDFSAGNSIMTIDDNKAIPDYYMDVPEFAGCKAFRAYSDSMETLIKSGNILFGTKVEEWNLHLEYGQIYGIICNDGRRYLKYIRKFIENPKEYFLLKSENDNYDDFEIPKKVIRSVWLIHGWINKRT